MKSRDARLIGLVLALGSALCLGPPRRKSQRPERKRRRQPLHDHREGDDGESRNQNVVASGEVGGERERERQGERAAQAEAQRDQAQLNLSYTTVAAAQSGRVANLSAAVGQYVTAGTALATFVPDEIWITANFKETQLDRMRPGQSVTIALDAYPERVLHGHVESVQPGSGTAFSLLPAENATGNYVKIVQRVPVKIVLDNPPADVALGPGMSVVPTVRVDPQPSLYERLQERLSELTGGRV